MRVSGATSGSTAFDWPLDIGPKWPSFDARVGGAPAHASIR